MYLYHILFTLMNICGIDCQKNILLNILYTFRFEIIRCFSLFQNSIRLDVF
jgi:hypothetical protein